MECQKSSSNYSQKQRRSHHSISILVVDDDTTCLSIVAALLKNLKYEVVTAKHANDALCALRIKGDAFDLVVSDIHMPDMNGFQLQQAIAHEFNLPVVLMSVDSKEVVFSQGLESGGAAFFISKPVSANDLKDLWQFASMRSRRRSEVVIEECRISDPRNSTKRNSQSSDEASDIIINTKKSKLVWTNALHYRFLEAIGSIGLERAVPKKILQVMNVPGLTRENVASHLQKYRLFLKRIADASHKLEIGENNEGSISNYSSSTRRYSHSLHYFRESATPFSYDEFPSRSFIDQSNQLIPITTKPNISIPRIDRSSQVGTTYSEAFPNDHYLNFGGNNELQSNIFSLDQCLGDAFHYISDSSNRQRLSSDHVLVGDCQDYSLPPLPPSNITLVNDHDLEFSSLDNIMAAQPFDPNHLHNQAQEKQNGCENRASDGMESNTPYDLSFAKELKRNVDDDDLESLLAFGDYQIQSLELEGI